MDMNTLNTETSILNNGREITGQINPVVAIYDLKKKP